MSENIETKTSENMSENEKIKAIHPQIIVTGEIDKPYYSIAYYDTAKKEWYIGYSSYELKYVRQWFSEFFKEVEGEMAEVVHGEWLGWGKGGMPLYENYGTCSVCHEDAEICSEHRNFCPNCGAKMDATDIDVGTKTNLPDDVRQNILNTFMKGSKD